MCAWHSEKTILLPHLSRLVSKTHAFDGIVLASRQVIRLLGMMRGGELAAVSP